MLNILEGRNMRFDLNATQLIKLLFGFSAVATLVTGLKFFQCRVKREISVAAVPPHHALIYFANISYPGISYRFFFSINAVNDFFENIAKIID